MLIDVEITKPQDWLPRFAEHARIVLEDGVHYCDFPDPDGSGKQHRLASAVASQPASTWRA